jgi:hypothetical protein
VTASSANFPFQIKDLRDFDLIDGGYISEKLNKKRVKFLKFYPVERLWNTAMPAKMLELF